MHRRGYPGRSDSGSFYRFHMWGIVTRRLSISLESALRWHQEGTLQRSMCCLAYWDGTQVCTKYTDWSFSRMWCTRYHNDHRSTYRCSLCNCLWDNSEDSCREIRNSQPSNWSMRWCSYRMFSMVLRTSRRSFRRRCGNSRDRNRSHTDCCRGTYVADR